MAHKILIVEDESTLHKALVDILIHAGYEVWSAEDGETAYRLAQKEQPDLVLLDIVLPIMNGYEVLRSIKTDVNTQHIPVIVLTNLGDLPDIEKALSLGANSYLIKADFHLDAILRKIAETLAN